MPGLANWKGAARGFLALVAAGCTLAASAAAHAESRPAPASPPPSAPWLEGVATAPTDPRPPVREAEPPAPLPVARRLDVGASVAFLAKLSDENAGGVPSDVTYDPTVGLEVHFRIPILDNVEVLPYVLAASHGVDVPTGSIEGLDGEVESGAATSLTLGARLARTFRVDPVRVWASAGVGYGRLAFGRMTVTEDGSPPFVVRERGVSYVEFPFGFGGAVELLPRWLSLDLELAAGPVLSKSGSATTPVRTIDGRGLARDVGALPAVAATFVGALGLSLIL